MNQKLSDWAGVAEIISGIAVVITLIFLVVGIRENTAIVRVSVYEGLIQEINAWNHDRVRDPEVERIVSVLFSGDIEALDERDRSRLITFIQALFRTYERAYFSRQYGVIGEAEWGRFERNICSNLRNARVIGHEMVGHVVLTDEFSAYMADTCQ